MRSCVYTVLLVLAALGSGAAEVRAQGPAAGDGWTMPASGPPVAVTRAEVAGRRAALAGAMGDGVLVVLGEREPSADYLPYVQNPPFRYLTGVTEPGAALVVEKVGGTVRETLFVQPRDPAQAIWEGERMGAPRASAVVGIAARPAGELRPVLDSLLAAPRTLYTLSPLPEDADADADGAPRPEQQLAAALADAHPGVRVVPLDAALGRLRAFKSAAELDHLRRAVLVTTLALREAVRAVRPGMAEFEVQALVEGTFRRNGAERPGFASIVGSGPNSTTLHYREADRFMAAGEVLVMDVGASYRGYSADVTRTVPVGGAFTPRQREVYAVVLDAQKAAEALAGPGASWDALNAAANGVIERGLARLGLVDAPGATYACEGGGRCSQAELFYPHGLGHGIGLDVHDPDASYFGPFRPGSAFTLEPGIYVRADVLDHLPDTAENHALRDRLAPAVARYRDVGVRIEDDYFVTAAGVERVSAGVPREMADVEALMREPSPWNAARHAEVVDWYRATAPR